MKNSLETAIKALKKHMKQNERAPSEPIIADGKPHFYPLRVDGKLRQGSYTATPYPLENDPNGPALIGWYGLLDEPEQFSYSSLAPKK